MRRATITHMERTCGAYPSQWEGSLDDGRSVFVHYRGGRGRIGVGNSMDDAVDATIEERWGACITWTGTGDPGRMSDTEVLMVLRGHFDVADGVLR